MNQWRQTTFDQLVKIRRGHDLPKSERREGTIPVVGSGGPSGWHDTAITQAPGVVIGRAGAMGHVTYCEKDFWPLNTTLYVTDFLGNDPKFVYYLLDQVDFSGYNSGAVQPMLNRNYISQMPVSLPDIAEQQAIVQVLGALDDKIAVNDRIENIINALMLSYLEVGLSAGCENLKLAEVAEFHNRKRIPLSSKERSARRGHFPYYGAAGIVGHVNEPIFSGAHVLVGEDGTVQTTDGNAVVQYVWGEFWVNNHAHVLTGKTLSTEALAVVLRVSNVSHLVSGAVQPKLSMRNLSQLELVIPNEDALRQFEKRIAPLMAMIRQKRSESELLEGLRNTLLPRLMSGEIRVKDAEKAVEEAT